MDQRRLEEDKKKLASLQANQAKEENLRRDYDEIRKHLLMEQRLKQRHEL